MSDMTVAEAVAFVREWRADDEQLRIPAGKWGDLLAYAVDLVVGAADHRVVTTIEELNAFPALTLIDENKQGLPGFHLWKCGDGVDYWKSVGGVIFQPESIRLPARVIYVPEVEQ